MKALMIIKPDGMKKFGTIFKTLEDNNIELLAVKSCSVLKATAEQLYAEHKEKYFYNALINYLTSSKVLMLAIEGDQQVILQCKKNIRQLLKPIIIEHAVEQLKCRVNKMLLTDNDDTFVTEYEKEYAATFDGIHCSDPGQGSQEIGLFFTEAELAHSELIEEKRILIIKDKIKARDQAKNPGIVHFGLFKANDNNTNTINSATVSSQLSPPNSTQEGVKP